MKCWGGEFPCIPMRNQCSVLDPSCSLMHDIALQHTSQGSHAPWLHWNSEFNRIYPWAIIDSNCNTFLRHWKPTFYWGRTPRPPCKNIYSLEVILQTFMPLREFHVACFSGRNPLWSPNIFYITSITILAESKFIKIVEFTPQKVPQCHVYPPKWPKIQKNDLKLGKNDLKYHDLKWDFSLGGLFRSSDQASQNPLVCLVRHVWPGFVFFRLLK